jgi:hypothetical protein
MEPPKMLAYNLTSTLNTDFPPAISVGQGGVGITTLTPDKPQKNSYWFCVLDAKNPKTKVYELVVPASNNAAKPAGLDDYASDPAYIIAVVTQNLYGMQVPQGDLYNFLTAHGAGRELQRLEQLAATHPGCGTFINVSYVLTFQGGMNFGYEQGSDTQRVQYLMSLMDSGGLYTLCDNYTF